MVSSYSSQRLLITKLLFKFSYFVMPSVFFSRTKTWAWYNLSSGLFVLNGLIPRRTIFNYLNPIQNMKLADLYPFIKRVFTETRLNQIIKQMTRLIKIQHIWCFKETVVRRCRWIRTADMIISVVFPS